MKQPNWKRWEVILLVNMYYQIQAKSLNVSEECQKLSSLLRRNNIDFAINSSQYRNYDGILMKYHNIRHIIEGKGLSRHSKLDSEIVELYNTNNESFKSELKAILSLVWLS